MSQNTSPASNHQTPVVECPSRFPFPNVPFHDSDLALHFLTWKTPVVHRFLAVVLTQTKEQTLHNTRGINISRIFPLCIVFLVCPVHRSVLCQSKQCIVIFFRSSMTSAPSCKHLFVVSERSVTKIFLLLFEVFLADETKLINPSRCVYQIGNPEKNCERFDAIVFAQDFRCQKSRINTFTQTESSVGNPGMASAGMALTLNRPTLP